MKEATYLKIVKFNRVTSTNDIANRLAEKGAKEITVVWAKGQTKGKGRRGRRWDSPYNKGLYVSFIFRPQVEVRRLNLLGMVIALSVIYALKGIIPVKIKWPNDIVYGKKKIGGILVEGKVSLRRPDFVIVGLGLNINTLLKDLPVSATSILIATKKKHSVDKIFKLILKEVIIWYKRFKKKDYKEITKKVSENLVTLGKKVIVYTEKGALKGTAYKIGKNAQLYVRDEKNEIKEIFASSVVHLR